MNNSRRRGEWRGREGGRREEASWKGDFEVQLSFQFDVSVEINISKSNLCYEFELFFSIVSREYKVARMPRLRPGEGGRERGGHRRTAQTANQWFPSSGLAGQSIL